MIKKVKKYLNFSYIPLIRSLIVRGQYTHTTYTDRKEPLITSNFYADGDALNVLYLKNNEYLAEDYPDKLHEHHAFFKKKIETMDIFADHIAWFVGVLSLLVSFTVPTEGNSWFQLGVSGGFVATGLALKKYIVRFLIWLTRFIAKIYAGKKKADIKKQIPT